MGSQQVVPVTPVSRLGSSPRLIVRCVCYVHCVLVTLTVSVAQAQTPAARVDTSAEPALVAIMPFANLSRHAADDWIGEGIAETVSADLTAVGLTLVEQTAVLGALGTRDAVDRERIGDTRALEIGRQLGATLLVRGTYQRVGDRLRITAHVVDVRSGDVVHSAKIDGSLSDLFAAQDQIVAALPGGSLPRPTARLDRPCVGRRSHPRATDARCQRERSCRLMSLDGSPCRRRWRQGPRRRLRQIGAGVGASRSRAARGQSRSGRRSLP